MDELYAQSAFDAWWERVGLPPQNFVYLLFDAYGHLLYVGITNNLRKPLILRQVVDRPTVLD